MDEDDPKSYRWETEYEKTWEALKEDESGNIQSSVEELVYKAIRKRTLTKKNIRLGMMRNLVVIIDMSDAMNQIELRPNRFICCLRLIEKFVIDFVDQNPISQLSFVTTSDKRAKKICDLSGNLKSLLEVVQAQKNNKCFGEASLQNALQSAYHILRHKPSHTSKEVLVVMGSLTSCDPSNIHETIDLLANSHIRCSVIGLGAEVYLCKSLANKTNGIYNIALEETHLKDLLMHHLNPLPSSVTESSLLEMGFPQYSSQSDNKPSLCECHIDEEPVFDVYGYFCPKCNSKFCDLPVECKVCGLTLVSSSHLARSYHYLFPLNAFVEVTLTEDTRCFACTKMLHKGKNATSCESCKHTYCIDCDAFIHDVSHVCPGCGSTHSQI